MRLVQLGVPKGAEYVVRRRVLTIGSAADNDVVLPYSAISRYHATIRQRLGRCILTDLNSTNGVIVNGRKIDGQIRLRLGDDIRFAGARFTLRHRKSFYPATIGATLFVTFGVAFAAMTIVTNRFTRTPEPITPVRPAVASSASPVGTPNAISASGASPPYGRSARTVVPPGAATTASISARPSAVGGAGVAGRRPATKVIYVANGGNNTVTEYAFGTSGETSTPIGIIVGTGTGLSGPTGVAVDAAGNIYAANNGNGTVTVYGKGSTGNAIPSAIISGPSTGLSSPTGGSLGLAGIAVQGDRIYVAIGDFGALGNGRVEVFPAGANGNVGPERTIEPPKLNRCVCSYGGFAVSRDSTVFIALGDCVFRYFPSASDFEEPKLFLLPDPCPRGLAIDSAGNLYSLRDDTLLEFNPRRVDSFVLRGAIDTGSAPVFSVDRDGVIYNVSESLYGSAWSGPGADSWSLVLHAPGGGAATPPIARIYGPASGLNQPTGIAVWP